MMNKINQEVSVENGVRNLGIVIGVGLNTFVHKASYAQGLMSKIQHYIDNHSEWALLKSGLSSNGERYAIGHLVLARSQVRFRFSSFGKCVRSPEGQDLVQVSIIKEDGSEMTLDEANAAKKLL
jgi:hypothetical protein